MLENICSKAKLGEDRLELSSRKPMSSHKKPSSPPELHEPRRRGPQLRGRGGGVGPGHARVDPGRPAPAPRVPRQDRRRGKQGS